MSPRKIVTLGLAMLLAAAGAGLSTPAQAGSVTYEIKADTSGLIPGAGGLLDISLNPSYPAGPPPSVSVDVFNPITDGTLGAANPISGTAAGDLTTPGGVTANNTMAMNELTQAFTVGSFFDVFVTLSGPEVGPGAVGPFSGTVFSFSLFDSGTGMEGAMLTVNPNVGPNGMPIIDGTVGIATTGPQVVVVLVPNSVPEPSSVVLMGLGIGAIVAIGRSRRKRATA
jgi:PEP-CTERM motif